MPKPGGASQESLAEDERNNSYIDVVPSSTTRQGPWAEKEAKRPCPPSGTKSSERKQSTRSGLPHPGAVEEVGTLTIERVALPASINSGRWAEKEAKRPHPELQNERHNIGAVAGDKDWSEKQAKRPHPHNTKTTIDTSTSALFSPLRGLSKNSSLSKETRILAVSIITSPYQVSSPSRVRLAILREDSNSGEASLSDTEVDEAASVPRNSIHEDRERQSELGQLEVTNTSSENEDRLSGTIPTEEDPSLAIANPVVDDGNQGLDLPQAEPLDAEERQLHLVQNRKKSTVRTLAFVAVGLTLVLAIVLPTTLFAGDNKNTNVSDAQVTDNSTQPPRAVQDRIYDLLSNSTLNTALVNSDSPQGKALSWTIGDALLNTNYSDERILQRFALATLYFSTGGESWYDNSGWLEEEINECNWFSRKMLDTWYSRDMVGLSFMEGPSISMPIERYHALDNQVFYPCDDEG